jgi:hypothetical protein
VSLAATDSFVWLVVDDWCCFVLREKYCWLVVGGWFVLREKYCWLVADKPSEQGGSVPCLLTSPAKNVSGSVCTRAWAGAHEPCMRACKSSHRPGAATRRTENATPTVPCFHSRTGNYSWWKTKTKSTRPVPPPPAAPRMAARPGTRPAHGPTCHRNASLLLMAGRSVRLLQLPVPVLHFYQMATAAAPPSSRFSL